MEKPGLGPPTSLELEGPRYPARQLDFKAPIKRIRMGMSIATSRANGEILDSMREIAQSQLKQLKMTAKERLLTSQEAAALHRIAQVFNIVDSGTRREQEAIDYKQFTDEDLAAAEEHALNLLRDK